MNIRLGTRGSKLALTQANLVKDAFEKQNLQTQIELIEIKTLGDRKQGTAAASNSDKKDWVYDLEMAIKNNSIDFAVHSGKDIPIDIEPGTELLPVLVRANPFDAFIGRLDSNNGGRLQFSDLPDGAKVGTASLRRRAHLLRLRPDLQVIEHRGNVPTRIKKMDESDDIMGIILASAGIDRLEINDLHYSRLTIDDMIPAINQGILVVQFRSDDKKIKDMFQKLVDEHTFDIWLAERAVAEVLEGDCKSAISIFAQCDGDEIKLTSAVMSPDGKDYVEVSTTKKRDQARELGLEVAKELLKKGADRIIEEARDFRF